MKVILPPWSKTINQIFIPLVKNADRYLIMWGGRGSSKSLFAAKKLIYRCLSEPYFRYILYRKTYNTIKDSQFQTIKDIVYDWGLQDLFSFNVSPMEIRCHNGNKFICRGGDDPKKLKSVKDPTGVWYEEEIPEEGDFITITTSIRTLKATYLQEMFTINPEVEGDYMDNWFYKRFFKDKPDGTFSDKTEISLPDGKKFTLTYTSHHSTSEDNRWIPDSFRAQLQQLKVENPYYYTIYALGRWGNKTTGGNFWKFFNRGQHTGIARYDPLRSLRLTFDFNVNPYMTLTVWQIAEKKAIQIDEMCLSNPKNNTEDTCKEFISRYSTHQSGITVYGDPSGKREDTRSEKGHNDFMVIQKALAAFKPTMHILSVAPSVEMSAKWLNMVLFKNEGGISVLISDKCQKTIDDFLYVKEAEDGTMSKAKTKDPDTGVTYEKYGHCFVGETMIETISGSKRIDCMQQGDLVLTRKGYKRVLNVFNNGIKEVKGYCIGKTKLTCTPDHKIWTKERGFVPIKYLIPLDTLCIFEENKICLKRLLITKEETLQDTPTLRKEQKGFITAGGLLLMGSGKRFASMFINTCAKLVKYLRSTMYTIRTKTQSITKRQTLSCCRAANTIDCTCQLMSGKPNQLKTFCNLQYQPHQNGINQMKAAHGIKSMPWKLVLGCIITRLRGIATNVEKSITDLAQEQDFAQTSANRQAEGNPALIMRKERVPIAEKCLLQINTQPQRGVQIVYDLKVEDEHEYFANGVLVHNCSDAFRYFMVSAFASDFAQYQCGGKGHAPMMGNATSSNNY